MGIPVIQVKQEAAVANKTQIIPNEVDIPTSMLEATSNLAENLLQSEPFLRYKAAERKLQKDSEAQQLLTDLSEMQQKIRELQYTGVISETDLKRLRALQNAEGTNDVIQEYGLAQELAITLLREVNQEISNLLGIDFASLTRRSGGCC
jgi:cell fate (sporulation/competence/biofilm development) regulator YlbF (YheA/YmcA/DUF963 family)